jgi:hypothetical protein
MAGISPPLLLSINHQLSTINSTMLLPLHWMSIQGRKNSINAASAVTRLIYCNTSGMPAAGLVSMPWLPEPTGVLDASPKYQFTASFGPRSRWVWESFIG